MFFDSYRVYYGVIPSNEICNGVAPGYRHIVGGWTDEAIERRRRGSQGYIDNLNNKNGFYTKLLESVKQEGVKNPICISAGYCVAIYQKYLWQSMINEDGSPIWEKVLVCDRKGGSRLWAAQQLDIDIPVIVSDFVGMFVDRQGFVELYSEDDIKSKFQNTPETVVLNNTGVNIGTIPHIHLDNPNEKC